ncbi:sugar phosphate isomerase/epimerase family protein [Paracoccus shanxieyensis]|uniref:TIM barrel protein n=1 Tax=Paracoccus shanxieyensis TaxID=2675752 RepID=A0A6L6IXW6_9RHOB|nr:sugar phosphate isomerase/epimerase family protein [Paracoccus shanxieyensis]MTH64122.1 TIM barrel protein [Paracoccus shanxieyensis]MTH87266.1 TIM barrel protein [Paracoccus shanxieyensis]
MKIAIDGYCYHRYFGEVYPGLEQPPAQDMTLPGFIARAQALGVEGISVESFMLPPGTPDLAGLRQALDQAGLDRMWAWGHPKGLGSGLIPEALQDLNRHAGYAAAVGARVMRICAGGRGTRTLSWAEHKALLVPLLERAIDHAADLGVMLAIENHIDFSAPELVELVETLGPEHIGVCLDTANNLRTFDDPSEVIASLAPYARAVHLKDVTAFRGSPRNFGFWPSVATGSGLIDMPFALDCLDRAGFDGLLAIEFDYLHPRYPDEDAALGESIAWLRQQLGR